MGYYLQWLHEFLDGFYSFTPEEERALEIGDRLMAGYVVDMTAEDVRINDSFLTSEMTTGELIERANEASNRIGRATATETQSSLLHQLFGTQDAASMSDKICGSPYGQFTTNLQLAADKADAEHHSEQTGFFKNVTEDGMFFNRRPPTMEQQAFPNRDSIPPTKE